jgi:hypothetical protein
MCVILHHKRHAFVIISLQYIFCMIYLLTCKACDYLNSLANQFVSLRIPDISYISIWQVKLCQIVGDELFFYMAYLFRSWQTTRFAK